MKSNIKAGNEANTLETDVIDVGAGFGGCYSLHKIREPGFFAKILGRRDDFGGVWHFKRYPRARVDFDTPAYHFSLPRVWADFHFTKMFPGYEEIRKYSYHVVTTLGVREDTIFNARVDEVKYDPENRRGRFRTAKGLFLASNFGVRKTLSCMTDCKNMDIVPPLKQFKWFGLAYVNLEKTPIDAFDEQGILTGSLEAATHHDLDAVIMAAGYDCVTISLLDMNIHDKNGNPLSDLCKSGIRTYFGDMIPNMPNAFMLYGSQGPTPQTNASPFIELQVDWAVS
ncbi:Baeyer-Villiger monooxygenase [Colletotrichum siamense]|uniref:Baeyer-Villiger monooxygenase n=1 Tax=Colletotrichum siamense TaxID=690259 RepID=UPI001872D447|nr:Baeyer-Villiger monooxygenase [Colletotrichum siamense]KAF5483048.1 Baeyer-Villiger monooxygenase [Colletotrichum siamense]